MYLLSTALLVALAGVWAIRAKLPPALGRTLLALTAMATLAALAGALLRPGAGPVSGEIFDRACGHRAGTWIRDHTDGPGHVLYVDVAATTRADKTGLQARLGGLHEALRDSQIVVNERTLSGAELSESMGGQFVPVSMIREAVSNEPSCLAVVLGQGLPVVTGGRPPKGLPPIISLSDPDSAACVAALRRGLLAGAVTPRSDADWQALPGPEMTLDEVFTMRYQWVVGDDS